MNGIIVVLVAAVVRAASAGTITNLDIQHTTGGGSYCGANGCQVPAGATVKITFTINVDTPIENLQWTARVGKSQNKIVFKDWHACSSGDEVVLQEAACSESISKGTHQGHAIVVLSVRATRGKLIVGGGGVYYSERDPVTIS